VAHTCNLSYSGGRDQEDCGSKPTWQAVHKILSLKYATQNRAGGVAQVVAHMPGKHVALSLRPSTAKNNK
jgi:hypothetical protein